MRNHCHDDKDHTKATIRYPPLHKFKMNFKSLDFTLLVQGLIKTFTPSPVWFYDFSCNLCCCLSKKKLNKNQPSFNNYLIKQYKMKTLVTTIAILFTVFFSEAVQAQSETPKPIDITTETVTVKGSCGMCKKRIEEAALAVYGVKSAVWNQKKQKLTLDYSLFVPEVILSVEKLLAEVGHDAGDVKAVDEVYAKLPGCCKYRKA